MLVLICGSRSWTDRSAIEARIAELPPGAVVINGKAGGADKCAHYAAVNRGLFSVPVPVYSPHWKRYGKAAGPMRNRVMLDLGPELVIAFQRDESSGTQDTIDEARRRGIPVEVHST